jgi:hypothetical protein
MTTNEPNDLASVRELIVGHVGALVEKGYEFLITDEYRTRGEITAVVGHIVALVGGELSITPLIIDPCELHSREDLLRQHVARGCPLCGSAAAAGAKVH